MTKTTGQICLTIIRSNPKWWRVGTVIKLLDFLTFNISWDQATCKMSNLSRWSLLTRVRFLPQYWSRLRLSGCSICFFLWPTKKKKDNFLELFFLSFLHWTHYYHHTWISLLSLCILSRNLILLGTLWICRGVCSDWLGLSGDMMKASLGRLRRFALPTKVDAVNIEELFPTTQIDGLARASKVHIL